MWSSHVYVCLCPGWGTAEMLGTKVIPLWVGARGMEFSWNNLQTALDANINLVRTELHGASVYLLWLYFLTPAVLDGDMHAAMAVEQERSESRPLSLPGRSPHGDLLSLCVAVCLAILQWCEYVDSPADKVWSCLCSRPPYITGVYSHVTTQILNLVTFLCVYQQSTV